jgi:class 3 adenylate cyclase/tetratricopeptide (TPR) repeat protein/ribosomal protein L40E
MKCPKCQFENPEEMQFCGKCGTKLERICPKCNFPNPPQFIFCGKCGYNLTTPSEPTPRDLSWDEKIDKIQRYLPEGLTKKILSQRDKIEGERKQVTVMFCDMEGFTPLVKRLGPEEAYAIMDQVYEILIHKVHDYEGTVNEMTGDGIMALFGAPIALEDAPQRAIRSAMAIHREMARFSERVKEDREGTPPIKMRVGIHTGPVVVGTLGNDLRVEFKAVGETVNLASRTEGLAEPGTTCITEETHRITEGLFRFEALGEKTVKGKKEPVKVYRVIAPSTSRTRFDVSAERGLTPFVGRERELDLLLDAFERAKVGRGQAISIISEAGIGKSRLLYEFRKAVSSEDVMFLEGRSLSYSRAVAYHPVIDIIKANFDIREGDRESEIRGKVIKGLKILRADEALTLPYFLELLSVKDSDIDKIPISPEAKKDRIIQAYKLITLKGSEIRPLILAFEDLHWVDDSSEDVLKYVFESIPGARVLMIFTYRPEFVHSWGGKSYHSQVNLNRLSNRESLAMVANLLGTEQIDSGLVELILEKTEGVPFFIEEFIKSLKELKVIERRGSRYYISKDIQDVAIPSTIQDVIMARVDSLPEGAKEVLQTGSIIEREFSYELIKQVTGLKEQTLLSHLSTLKDSELLYERGIYPQSTYIFKHALTQQVVYDSILTKRKRKYHEEIAKAIEELYKDNIEHYYGMLAEHFIDSENFEKGAAYSKLASKRAERTGSLNEAISYALKRVSCIEKLPRTDGLEEKIIELRIIVGLFLLEMNYFKRAREIVAPVIESVLKGGNDKRMSQILTIIGTYEFAVEENYPRAFEHLEKALRISKEIEDMFTLAPVSYWIGCAQCLNCELEKAAINIGRTEKIVRSAKISWREATLKSLLSHLVYYYQGRIDFAHETSRQAVRIATESGDIYSKAFAYSCHGISCFGKGSFQEAVELLSIGREFSERLNHDWWHPWSNQFLGEVYFETGQYQKARDHYEKATSLFDRNGTWPSNNIVSKIGLARTQVLHNKEDFSLEAIYVYVKVFKAKLFEGWIRRYISEILLSMDEGRISEAEEWIKQAITADSRNGTLFELGRDYSFYAAILRRKGEESDAQENLNKAIEIYKECGADGWVKKAEKELAELL